MASTYTEVGDDGIDDGEREPSLAVPVCRCGEARLEPLFSLLASLGGVVRIWLEVICLRSAAGELWADENEGAGVDG